MNKKEFKEAFFTNNFYWVNKDNYKDLQEIALEMGCLCHTGTKEIIEWHRGFKNLGFRTKESGLTFFQKEPFLMHNEVASSYEEMKYHYQRLEVDENKDIGLSENIEPKPLFLVLEKVYFDRILEGSKDIEYRENKPFYQSRLMRNGKYRNFEAVTFQEGYHKQARRMTVKIKKIILFNDIFEIHLDEIIETSF